VRPSRLLCRRADAWQALPQGGSHRRPSLASSGQFCPHLLRRARSYAYDTRPRNLRRYACAGMENTVVGVFGVLSLLRILSRLARRTMYRRDLHCRWMLVLPLTVTLCLPTSLLSAAGDIDGQECTVDREYDVQTSIGCVGGSCNGELVVFLEQSSCKSKAGGGDCEESTEFLSITAPPKVKFLGYLKWARCSGGTAACLACAAAAAAAAPTPPTAAALAVLCGAVCLITADPCCYNTCVPDFTRKIKEPGGKVCNRESPLEKLWGFWKINVFVDGSRKSSRS